MKYLCVLMVFFFASCMEEKSNDLSYEELRIVDSLYSKKSSMLKKEVDSICNARHDALFDSLVDSIKQDYISEIEQIIK